MKTNPPGHNIYLIVRRLCLTGVHEGECDYTDEHSQVKLKKADLKTKLNF